MSWMPHTYTHTAEVSWMGCQLVNQVPSSYSCLCSFFTSGSWTCHIPSMYLLKGGKDALDYKCTLRSQHATTDAFPLTLTDQLSDGLVFASRESFQDHGNWFLRPLHRRGDPDALSMPRKAGKQDSACIYHISALCVSTCCRSTCCPITTEEEINPISLQEEGPVRRHLPFDKSHPEALTFCPLLVQSPSPSPIPRTHILHHSFG